MVVGNDAGGISITSVGTTSTGSSGGGGVDRKVWVMLAVIVYALLSGGT